MDVLGVEEEGFALGIPSANSPPGRDDRFEGPDVGMAEMRTVEARCGPAEGGLLIEGGTGHPDEAHVVKELGNSQLEKN